ncbi:transport protein [Fusarium subglutinans]|uniref:Transport protein n=1 Tax=Gibberella subglutinans TaxID=42677 RepID=A0A8H5L7H5_GIBSU|nr:transport protein [Fusarium subglutinans]KAF5587805.1 transport protein [Fusarium subglutinans]
MRFCQIAPLALWAGAGAASGSQLFHDTFQLNELPDMVSLADAKLKDIVLPDSLSDFTEWIGGIAEPRAFGLQPRQKQCVDAGYSVSDAVLKAAPVSPPAAVAATPKNAAPAAVTIHHHKSVAAATIKSTETVTTTKMKTVRVTTDIEPDTGNAPEFTCVPMTATNDEGATLELDEGCTLHYEPPRATTTDDSAARLRRDAATAPAHVNRGHNPLVRQVSCTPYTIYTTTEWETETETETGTKTVTVQGEDATFSCPEMEVTNDVGDTLALDAECVLSFTPAKTTSSEEGASAQDQPTNVPARTGEGTTTVTATAGSGGSNDNSGSFERASLSLTLSFAGIAMLSNGEDGLQNGSCRFILTRTSDMSHSQNKTQANQHGESEALLAPTANSSDSSETSSETSSDSDSTFSSKLQSFYSRNIGLFYVLVAQLFASIMSMTTRLLETGFETKFHALQIIFVRMLATALIGSVYMWYSLSYLDISDATVITFLVPTLTAFIAWVALREPFTVKEATAGFIAFAGVLFVARPAFLFPESWRTLSELESRAVDPNFTADGGILPPVKATPQERTIAILCAIFGSFAAATAYATIRVIGKRAHSLVSVNYFAVLATVSSFLVIMIHPDLQFEIPKTIAEWCLLLSIGVSGFLLQLLLTEGLQREKAGRATNLIYVQMVFALIIERIVWGTTPPITSFIGSALIIGSAIWVSLQKKAPAEPRPLLDEERRQQ